MISKLWIKGSSFIRHVKLSDVSRIVYSTTAHRTVRVLLPLFAALLLSAAALDFGSWHYRQTARGPFSNTGGASVTLYARVGMFWPLSAIIGPLPDTMGVSQQSDLLLSLNGIPWGPPHTLHREIATGETRGYSHWGNVVYFALPHGMANDRSLTLTADYSLHVRPRARRLLEIGFIITLLLRFCHVVRRRIPFALQLFVHAVGLLGDNSPNFIRLLIGLALLYAGSIAYGVLAGFALPTAAFSFLLPHPNSIIEVEECWPFVILGLAAIGALGDWLAWLRLLDRQRVLRNRHTAHRLLCRWGLPTTVLVYVFGLSDGGWSGHISTFDLNYMSIGGLMPYSDALNYVLGIVDQLRIGSWNAVASGRPLAAAFRQLTVALSGFSYTGTLLVQTILISLSAFVVARKVAAWRGIWAGLGFTALIYIVARPFLATAMTEPLALVWALVSTACLIEAMRCRSLAYAMLGLVTLSTAMSIRLGSVLSLPAVAIWIAFVFRERARDRAAVFVVASGLVCAILALGKVASALYGAQTPMGGDFAYTACGLTLGADWTACPRVFASQLAQLDENAKVRFMYSAAWHNLTVDPFLVLRTMSDNVEELLAHLWQFLLHGYMGFIRAQTSGYFLQWLLIPGIFISLSKRRATGERSFWLLLLLSTMASAAIIFHDDGWRTLNVTWAFAALFASFGFVPPLRLSGFSAARQIASPRLAGLSIALALLLVLAAPWITDRWKRPELRKHSDAATGHDGSSVIAPMMGGFVVIPDGEDRPRTVPALHVSDLIRLIHDTPLPLDQNGFVGKLSSLAPFGFVVGAQAIGDHSPWAMFYVTPPKVVSAPANGWLFDISARLVYGPYAIVLYVDKANAIQ